MFRSSSALASAYVLAVAATNVVAGLLGFFVIWTLWQWQLWAAALLMVPFIVVDTVFLAATTMKLLEGAWAAGSVRRAVLVLLVVDLAARHPPARAEDAPHRGSARHADAEPGEEDHPTRSRAPPCS